MNKTSVTHHDGATTFSVENQDIEWDDVLEWDKPPYKPPVKLLVIFLIVLAYASYSCQGAVDDAFLRKVEQIESSGREWVIGDSGKARGLFQFHAAAWKQCTSIRRNQGLATFPYSQATNAYIARLYAGTWFQHLRSYLVASGIKPTRELLLMCHQCGIQGAKRRNYDLTKAPEKVQIAVQKLK